MKKTLISLALLLLIASRSEAQLVIPPSGGSGGTVTSVGLTVPTILSVSGSPVTGSGTLAVTTAVTPTGTGAIVLADSPTVTTQETISATSPVVIFDGSHATDTDYWMQLISDGAGTDDDGLWFGKGTTPGSNRVLCITTSGCGITNATLSGNKFVLPISYTNTTNWRGLTIHDADGNGTPMISGQGAGTGAGSALYLQCNAGAATCLSFQIGGSAYWNINGLTGDFENQSGTFFKATGAGGYKLTNLVSSNTAPTIASGGCTSPAVTSNNGTAAFLLTVGSSCSGVKTIVLTLPAAAHFWACAGDNNTSDAQQQTNYIVARATSTTAVTLTSYDRTTGVQEDLTASDTYLIHCTGE